MKTTVKKKRFGGVEYEHTHMCNHVADMACRFLEKHAMIAGDPDGCDEAGRQKFKLPETTALVKRAFDMAEEFFGEAEMRGLLVEVQEADKDE